MATLRNAKTRTAKKSAKRATTAGKSGNAGQDALFREQANRARVPFAIQNHIISAYGSGSGLSLIQRHGAKTVQIVKSADLLGKRLNTYISKEILDGKSDTTAEGVRKFDFKNEITRVPLAFEPGIRLCALSAAERGMTGDQVIALARQATGLIDLRAKISNWKPGK